MKYYLSICFCLLLLPCSRYTVKAQNPLVKQIMKGINCNEEQAMNFLYGMQTTIEAVQTNFTNIASKSYDKFQKSKMIDEVINSYFVSERSYVQISPSPNTDVLRTFYIRNYLNRLIILGKTTDRDVSFKIELSEIFDIRRDSIITNKIIIATKGWLQSSTNDYAQKTFVMEVIEENDLMKFKIKGIHSQPILTEKEYIQIKYIFDKE